MKVVSRLNPRPDKMGIADLAWSRFLIIMTTIAQTAPTVVRTTRGLTIAGTRTTLYSLMDYLHAGWTVERIREWLSLSAEQMSEAMAYIQAHRQEVEAEYQQVLRQAEENKRYWEGHHREHAAKTARAVPRPDQEKLREKLRAWKKTLRTA